MSFCRGVCEPLSISHALKKASARSYGQFQPQVKLKTGEIGLKFFSLHLSPVSPKKILPFIFGNPRCHAATGFPDLCTFLASPRRRSFSHLLPPSDYSCLTSPSPRANSLLRKEGQLRCSLLVRAHWDVLSKAHLHFNRGLVGLGREVNNGSFLRDH